MAVKAIHENDKELGDDIMVVVSSTGDLKEARKMYDLYIQAGNTVDDADTMCVLAMLWRELKDHTRLLDAIRCLEKCTNVTDDHRANALRELSLYYAKKGGRINRARAAALARRIQELRIDPQQKIVDTIAGAKCLLYASDFPGALEQIKTASGMIMDAFRVVEQDVHDHDWWALEIAELAGDELLAQRSASSLLGGRMIHKTWVPPEGKPTRVMLARAFSWLQRRPWKTRFLRKMLARTALFYDRLH